MQPENTTKRPGGGPAGRPARRLAFAPRAADGDDTADSVSRESRLRRNRRLGLAMAFGAILVAAIGLVDFGAREDTAVQVGIQEASVGQGGTVSLRGLSYKGLTKEGGGFSVLAEHASESTEQPDRVVMTAPRAMVETETGAPITIRSNNGELVRGRNTVSLTGKVVIVRPDIGYTLLTEEAFADLETGEIVSGTPVRGFGPGGSISAEGIAIAGDGGDIVFTGSSTLVVNKGFRPVE